jgi:hypothetical protein
MHACLLRIKTNFGTHENRGVSNFFTNLNL